MRVKTRKGETIVGLDEGPRRETSLEKLPGEQEANAKDPILSSIDDPKLRRTLVASDKGEALRFDIYLQGENQTAFFEL